MSNQRQRKPEGDRLFISSLAKGLEVLQCFGAGTPELSVSDISRITRMPQPTVWRICHTLIKLGYLTNAQGRQTLRPGIPVLTLGYAALSSSPLGELALADMQAIASKHSGAVSLGARNGLDMVYAQRCQGSAIILADLRVGSRVPIATSATGWAYIAGLGANDRMALLSELGEALGKQWASVAPKLTAALQEFDELGYIVNIGSLHSRINSVAVPVKSPESATLLSLSSGGINEVFTPDVLSQVGSELKQLAAKLSPLLGRVSL